MERQLTYDVSFDKECESDDQFLVLSEGVFDDSIISFGTRTFKQEGCNTTFEVGDASRFCRTTIIDVKRQLILSRQETSFIRRMTCVLQMGAQYGEGSVCSPIISCIYMHYVLMWWFKEVVTPMLKGYAGLVVYADDFVVTFQYKSDAVWFYKHLKHRM